jgi:protein-disulfide isomerase-like protein with CxxC motif
MAMDAAIDRLEHAQMVARETGDPFWEAMAERYDREATAAIAAYEASEAVRTGGEGGE